jgi:23S rRNA (pseudouridine1915-N3)-methyltransferase
VKLKLVTVGKGAPSWADAAVADYAKRLRRLGGVEEHTLKPEKFRGDVDAVRRAEGGRILQFIKPRDRLVVLDERGVGLSTEDFTKLLESGLQAEASLVFTIGGPYGHDPAVRQRAWRVVRLSDMVLNHQVARVVWFEQVYRAMTLMNGTPYHH